MTLSLRIESPCRKVNSTGADAICWARGGSLIAILEAVPEDEGRWLAEEIGL